jgi:hypothetical protein
MQNYQKILLAIIATIAIVIGGIHIYLDFFLEEQLQETGVKKIHAATDNAYNIEVGDLDLHIFSRRLSISTIRITKKGNSQTKDLHLTLDEFNISGINLTNFLFRNKLTTQKVNIVNPKVYLSTNRKNSSSKKIGWRELSGSVSETALKVLDSIFISEFNIKGLSINNTRTDASAEPNFSISNSDITLSNISIDSTSLTDNRIIPAENIEATAQNMRWQTPTKLYDISAKQFQFSSSDSILEANNFSVLPKFKKGAFSKQVGHEIDRINLGIQQIKGVQIDVDQVNNGEGISAGLISIENADLDIYRDKRRSDPAKSNKPLPQEMIHGIPFPVSFDSIRISKSNIRYSERVQNADKAGYIEFANLSAGFSHLTNIESRWKTNPPTLIAETKVMNKARLNVQFKFFTADKGNRQEIKGTLQPMDMKPLNNILQPIAFVQIDRGKILGLDFDMNLSENHAGGTLTLQYKDLKVSLLDDEGAGENLGDKARSFLANTFKIKSENKGEKPRVSQVDFKRVKHKSVFNYWWKSLLSGLKENIGL